MMVDDSYLEIIGLCGGRREVLESRERWRLSQRWRETFALGLHAARGRWKLGEFDWLLFSFEYAPAWRGARAVAAYQGLHPPSFIVCPERESSPAVRIIGGELPDFQVLCDDICVWPEDLTWTMAFTHERDREIGPYFSESAWVLPPTLMPGA
jgi:hypothetical protein